MNVVTAKTAKATKDTKDTKDTKWKGEECWVRGVMEERDVKDALRPSLPDRQVRTGDVRAGSVHA